MRRRHREAAAEPGARLTLADLRPEESARITELVGPPAIQSRLRDLGFVEGERVRMVKTAPLADPAEYCVQGVDIGLRRSEAGLVRVADLSGGGPRRPRRGRGWRGHREPDGGEPA
jgi:ferrous iron transport protein B